RHRARAVRVAWPIAVSARAAPNLSTFRPPVHIPAGCTGVVASGPARFRVEVLHETEPERLALVAGRFPESCGVIVVLDDHGGHPDGSLPAQRPLRVAHELEADAEAAVLGEDREAAQVAPPAVPRRDHGAHDLAVGPVVVLNLRDQQRSPVTRA